MKLFADAASRCLASHSTTLLALPTRALTPIRVIYDTDMHADIDDVFAPATPLNSYP